MVLTLLTAGAFGAAVAQRLAARVPELRTAPLSGDPGVLEELLAGSDFAAAALWRRYPAECEVLDEVCRRLGIPWSQAVLEETRLAAGPVVSPGAGPCHLCYRRRWLTHVPQLDRELAVESAYAADASLGIEGFPPAAVVLAVSGLLLDRREHQSARGRLRQTDLMTGSVQETRVVPVHGCPRCSTTRPGTLSVEHLVPAVDAILS